MMVKTLTQPPWRGEEVPPPCLVEGKVQAPARSSPTVRVGRGGSLLARIKLLASCAVFSNTTLAGVLGAPSEPGEDGNQDFPLSCAGTGEGRTQFFCGGMLE